MTALLNFFQHLSISPTGERDYKNIFSPARLGVWFLVLNLLIIGSCALGLLASQELQNDGTLNLSEAIGLGQTLCIAIFLALTVFLTVFIPIRIAGFILAPRAGRFFDQIVLSGISPIRYVSGKIIVQNGFYLMIIAATIPYLILCISLGGLDIWFVVSGVFLLWLYTNVLAFTAISLGLFVSEWMVLPLMFLFFGIMTFWGCFPFPPNLILVSPSSAFMAYFFENIYPLHLGNGRLEITPFETQPYGGVLGLSAHTTQCLNLTILSFLICGACLVIIALGPTNSIHKLSKSFGEIVLLGDRRRTNLATKRPLLSRRSEISFFYQNRHASLMRWDFWGRWMTREIFFLFWLALPVYYFQRYAGGYSAEDFSYQMLASAIPLLLLNAFLFSKDRTSERIRYRLMEAGIIDWCFFLMNLVLIFLFFGCSMFLRDHLEGSTNWLTRRFTTFPRAESTLISIAVCILFALEFYALLRLMALRLWSRLTAFIITPILFVFTTFALPLVTNIPAAILSDLENPLPYQAEFIHLFSCLFYLSPPALLAQLNDPAHSAFNHRIDDAYSHGFLLSLGVHGVITLFFIFRYARTRKKLPILNRA